MASAGSVPSAPPTDPVAGHEQGSYLINQMRDWASIRALVKVLATLGVLVSIVGLAGVLGLWRPEISSPLGRLLPQWVAETDYGRLFVVRSIGREAFLPWIGRYLGSGFVKRVFQMCGPGADRVGGHRFENIQAATRQYFICVGSLTVN